MKLKALPKTILSKLTTAEIKKLEKLQDNYVKTGDKMEEVQAISSVAMRKEMKERPGQPWSAATQQKINKGFKCMSMYYQASDELKAYMEEMRKKY
jgi:hypothetical protein